MRRRRCRRTAVAVAAALISLAVGLASGRAQDLTVTPTVVMLSDSNRAASLRVVNQSDLPIRVSTEWQYRRMTPEGTLVESALPDLSVADMARYAPRVFTVPGRGAQRVRFLLRPRSGTPPGEYRAHLLIRPVPPTEDINAQFGNRVRLAYAIPFIARLGTGDSGGAIAEGEITTVRDDQLVAQVRLRRTGIFSVRGTLIATDQSGELGRVVGIAVYHDLPERIANVPLLRAPSGPVTVRYQRADDHPTAPDEVLSEIVIQP